MAEHEPDDAAAGEEAQLVERARQGDEVALGALFARHEETMRRFAERRLPLRLRRRVSVADVLQESRLVAARRCAGFEDRGGRSFRNWLLGIVARKVKESVRCHEGAEKRSLRRELTRGARPDTHAFHGVQPTPSAVVVGAEAAAQAEAALRDLPDDYREILVLTRKRHMDLDEAAAHMGRSREAARKLLARAVARFAETFDALRDEGDDG